MCTSLDDRGRGDERQLSILTKRLQIDRATATHRCFDLAERLIELSLIHI